MEDYWHIIIAILLGLSIGVAIFIFSYWCAIKKEINSNNTTSSSLAEDSLVDTHPSDFSDGGVSE